MYIQLYMSEGLKAAAIALDQLYPSLNASDMAFDTKAVCIVPTSQLSLTPSAIAAMYDYSDAFVTPSRNMESFKC